MKTPTAAQLANTRPQGLRTQYANMPATIAPALAGLSEVVGGYLTAMYFTDCGDLEQPPHDAELAPLSVLRAARDCADFMAQAQQMGMLTPYGETGQTLGQLGHDLWLTRNGHGAGFWDRGALDVPFALDPRFGTTHESTLGGVLSDVARRMGACDTYQGDDGLIYFE